jgi:hypothetical protein
MVVVEEGETIEGGDGGGDSEVEIDFPIKN